MVWRNSKGSPTFRPKSFHQPLLGVLADLNFVFGWKRKQDQPLQHFGETLPT
ncbi:MAG: hypothetical protein LBP87_00880 [Planctomycetaceae bacterium]|nr:hypothetical protein [Planctomycetaceae bacterium]